MNRRAAVNGEANVKAVLLQKAAPGIIQKQAVGLQVVPGLPAPGKILLLQLHHLLIEVQTGQCGLAAVPGKGHHRSGACGDILPDHLFQKIKAHPGLFGMA